MTTTIKVGETTFETRADCELVMRRLLEAPRSLVFEVMSSPEHLPRWYGPLGWSLPVCEVDFREGGAWRYSCEGPDGTTMSLRGEFREIRAPERLVTTESFDEHPIESLNSLVLSESDGRTTMEVTVVYPSKALRDTMIGSGMLDGASQSYDRLAEYLRGLV